MHGNWNIQIGSAAQSWLQSRLQRFADRRVCRCIPTDYIYLYSFPFQTPTIPSHPSARLVKEESRLIRESSDVSVETRKGLQMYGCMAIVICMYFVGMYVDYL